MSKIFFIYLSIGKSVSLSNKKSYSKWASQKGTELNLNSKINDR